MVNHAAGGVFRNVMESSRSNIGHCIDEGHRGIGTKSIVGHVARVRAPAERSGNSYSRVGEAGACQQGFQSRIEVQKPLNVDTSCNAAHVVGACGRGKRPDRWCANCIAVLLWSIILRNEGAMRKIQGRRNGGLVYFTCFFGGMLSGGKLSRSWHAA